MGAYLNSNNISLKFSLAEELANTELIKALIIMLDIYESAIYTYEHHIVDAIGLWICREGNQDILYELNKRINQTNDIRIKDTYANWVQNIKSR